MISNNQNGIMLSLNPNFYDFGCVKEAAEEFGKQVKMSVEKQDKYNVLFESDSEDVAYEFCNYVLGLMCGKGLV